MRPSVILKVAILLLMLVGVVYAMRSMSEQSVAKFFAALGIEAGSGQPGSVDATMAGDEKFNICKTRVRAVVWPDGRRIEESREHVRAVWLAVDPNPREIGSLDVEKWFSRHCVILVREDEATRTAQDGFNNFLTFEFIDGTRFDFQRTDGGIFRVSGGRQFRSEEFDAAVTELVGLAQLQPVGP